MDAWRASSEGASARNRGGDADDERPVGTPRRSREDGVSIPAAVTVNGSADVHVGAEGGAEARAGATLEPFVAWEKNVAGARQPAGERWCLNGEGQAAEEDEEYVPIEERLEAVMKDLGVPLRDEVGSMEKRSRTPPPAHEARWVGVADGGGDGQVVFEAPGSASALAVMGGTRDRSTEAGGGEGGGVAIRSGGGKDGGFAAGVRTVSELPRD